MLRLLHLSTELCQLHCSEVPYFSLCWIQMLMLDGLYRTFDTVGEFIVLTAEL
jgi:hypothetical protein